MTRRVRLNPGCPWPERRGAAGVVLDRPDGPAGDVYPWSGLGRREVVVLLDDDPLRREGDDRGWTCVLDAADVDPEEEEAP